ncbi:MAG: Asp-tRNA(Asn)/Glu-tRNA(Gln) amidotransferase subunit GatB [Candidatus Pacebacteria bacterium]|nr:Asp-tRNA(Asn)/Glu-tRNA(Gln) amidotransferase subunit GatB [Candidatus Paceibacterota bacterium]
MKKNMAVLEPVIGLEIHLELTTRQKMFCRCPADHFGKEPNTQTCPVCLGLPGALPYPNQKAIEDTVLLGLALGCRIPKKAKFDRKNYFYPDLPKGYQISQYDQPFALGGGLKLKIKNETYKTIRINRVHLEEDTGKLVHRLIGGRDYSLIDFNRSSVPLVEVVTEPDIASIEELIAFGKKIHQLVRYLGISPADMQKGQMRFELNLSMRPREDRKLPDYRVEVKNLNSFKFLKAAAEYEIKRQSQALIRGQKLLQETRGFNEKKMITFAQRSKEEAHDYRYFPEADIPPISWPESAIRRIKKRLPELPEAKQIRFQRDFRLNPAEAERLTREKSRADYFEKAAVEALRLKLEPAKIARAIINKRIETAHFSPIQLAERIAGQQKLNKTGRSDTTALVEKVLAKYPGEVNRYREGKIGLIQFFIGQIMKESRGLADPEITRTILLKKLNQEQNF